MLVSEVLAKAADLIEPEGKWTQFKYGQDADGKSLFNGYDSSAVCWCAYGAIENVTGQGMGGDIREAAIGFLSWGPSWNDAPDRTQAEVVAKLREAAALAKAQGQ